MARSKKSSRKKRQVDWVVNDETYGLNIILPNASQVALALTLPQFYATYVDPIGGTNIPAYQYPEQDEGQEAYAVRGHVSVVPSVWAVGSTFSCIMRIVKKPISYGVVGAGAITDLNYSLYQAEFANERFVWQRYILQQNNMGAAGEVYNINWSGHQKLEPDEALWLFIENQSGITQDLRIWPYLRTLMRANG